MLYHHTPALLEEVIDYLKPIPGQNFIDCTLGGGGHAIEIAKRVLPAGKVLGIDLDPGAIKHVKSKKISNLVLVNDNYKNLEKIINERFSYPIHGILLDLGLSSAQLASGARGFSFQADGPLDMRFGATEAKLTAKKIVNTWPETELTRIFKQYGEEPKAKKIAQAIIKYRKTQPINTTHELSKIIINIVGQIKKIKKPCPGQGWDKSRPAKLGRGKHPATRVFQALRIAVNNEFQNLKQTLPQALKVLEPGARLAVISFHSLEDRIVKDFLRQESRDCLCPPSFPICKCGHQAQLKIITRKPIVPTAEEIKSNPRSRSAKLRVAEKI